jgi:formate hydrogenlyase subunit 6/NADH:ubiquinone oxidoreductase subunit I
MPMDALDRILRPLRRGPVTSRYPALPPDLPPAARGLPVFSAVRCDGIAACVTVCPTRAIRVTDDAWALDAGACIFCGACARACPNDAISLGPLVELATDERAGLIVTAPRGTRP